MVGGLSFLFVNSIHLHFSVQRHESEWFPEPKSLLGILVRRTKSLADQNLGDKSIVLLLLRLLHSLLVSRQQIGTLHLHTQKYARRLFFSNIFSIPLFPEFSQSNLYSSQYFIYYSFHVSNCSQSFFKTLYIILLHFFLVSKKHDMVRTL